jgi:uncharacterized damage-inducible protein DinB
MLTYFQELAHYQSWADAQFFSRWKQLEDARTNQSILKLSNHMVLVQKLFLDALEQNESAMPEKDKALPSVSEMETICRSNQQRLLAFLNGIPEETLSKPVSLPWFRSESTLTVADAVLQIFLHTQHHRAQVLQMLSPYAEKSMVIDYIAWIYKGKPAPAWQ